jgi:two-component system response regulator CpxR
VAIVSIFSGTYCHGEEVARAVTDELGYERIDDKLIEETSRRFAIPEEKLLRAMTGPLSFWNNFTHEREKNVACLKVVLSELAKEDDKIIFGYAGLMIPRDISHAMRVCVIANFPYRLEQVVKSVGKPEKDATKILHKDDEERLQWTSYLFDKAPYDEEIYDLIVPMQDSSVEEACRLISDTTRSEPLKTTAVSQIASRDFQLAAQVNRVLAMANHIVDVTVKHGDVTISINQHVMRMKSYQEELKRLAKEIPGVSDIHVQLGPKYHAPAINPMANVELPPKFLLVDDEQEFVQTLSERLKTRNMESTVVYDGEQALEFVEQDQPDVMVLDLMMPGIGGIEVLRRLKRTHRNIEVIILTGHGSEQEEQLAADLGAFAYLQKPVNIEVLAQVMREAYQKVNEARGESRKEDT